jgi:hypothetical protein
MSTAFRVEFPAHTNRSRERRSRMFNFPNAYTPNFNGFGNGFGYNGFGGFNGNAGFGPGNVNANFWNAPFNGFPGVGFQNPAFQGAGFQGSGFQSPINGFGSNIPQGFFPWNFSGPQSPFGFQGSFNGFSPFSFWNGFNSGFGGPFAGFFPNFNGAQSTENVNSENTNAPFGYAFPFNGVPFGFNGNPFFNGQNAQNQSNAA